MATRAQIPGLGEYVKMGFTLGHPDDHVVELYHQGKLTARFSQSGATEHSLQAECAKHLVEKHNWDGCLWSNHKRKKEV